MMSTTFSWNLARDLALIWQYAFERHAFEAGTVIAIVAGVIGYFVVLRQSSFAAHALSHIGFAGAAGAVLMGLQPLWGLLAFTSGGGVAMAALGRRAAGRDVQIGTVLAFMLGLGALFMSLYKGYATEAYSILFGQIVGISQQAVLVTVAAGLALLAAVAVMYRPLLLSSLDEDVAEARGLPTFGLGAAFMLLIAIAVSIAVQIVGVLLIFALMVTPAAAAHRMARRPARGILISVVIALLATWSGIFISFFLPVNASFFIVTITFAVYSAVRTWQWVRK
ncbi:MAG: metal ABC transporter permease [Verrucomicrobia bacterium]|nr:metal ABC transporter permease [Verrucomicrobiota bacterium]MDE3099629.1 metal ABC transporter permease [Verrucomicrobiota bacterium]